jgi:thiamine-monophosphate kinase
MKLYEIGEFGLIKRLAGGCVNDSSTIIEGIGDDAAVLQPGKGQLLATSDMLVEGVHFLPGKITMYQLGCKSIAVSLSDIAAMGGTPRQALVSLAIPGHMAVEEIEELYRGMKSILSRYAMNLVGGDTVKSPVLIIDVTVLGEAGPAGAVLRSGACPGDAVLVTGTPGASAAGLEILLNPGGNAEKFSPHEREWLLAAHLAPEPALEQSAALMQTGCVTSMIDISDGIAGEINHICDRSGVGVEIFAGEIPLGGAVGRAAALMGKSALDWALFGGEDYQLLFTAPAGEVRGIIDLFKEKRLGPVTVIGRIVEAGGGRKLVVNSEKWLSLNPSAYNHFVKDR